MAFTVEQLLEAAGGQVVGKVKLQKLVYLLDQLGMNSGLEFDYHHYGPYSAELTDMVDDEKVFGAIKERVGRRDSDGVAYSIFTAADEKKVPKRVGALDVARAQSALEIMMEYSSTILELAATANWLATVENVDDWREELYLRKGIKTENGRDRKALELLGKLGIPPA